MNPNQEQNLTIIILTYNSSQVIADCLSKLNFEKYKVVIVDNASRDNTLEVVRKKFPQANIIELHKNIGYGKGNNVALNQVTTEFALVLNPDAMILEKDIEVALEAMRRNPLAALAGPAILKKYPLNQEELKAKVMMMEQDSINAQKDYYEKVDGNFVARFLSGAVLFMKISIMKKIGFFDEKIFLYYEDNELCHRVQTNGYQNIAVPTVVPFHVGGESSGSSLRVIYKKSWHLTWSKLYWKNKRKGFISAKRTAFKFSIVYLIKTLFFLLSFNIKKSTLNLGAFFGALSFFIGLNAFKKNGDSRG